MPNLLKKVVAGFSTFAMAASLLVAPVTAHAAAAGEVYKTSDGTVWFITSDMQRRPFTSAGAFLSYGFLSFSQVKDADASVTALPSGAFIAPADGKIFCATETKGSDVKGECSLITGGQKAAFTSAAVFGGQGFSFSRAIYGDSSFLTKTTNIDTASAGHRAGVLVNNGGTVQMIVSGGLWGIPSIDVFNSWGYSFADVVPANAADKTLSQIGVIPGRVAGQLVPTGTTSPTPSGNYSASLSSDNPAAGTLIAGQSVADLAHFTVSGSGTITSMKFKRTGVSADSTLSNVYLFEGGNRLTDAASVSGGFITFAGLNLSVSGSRSFAVKSDIASGTSGQTVGVQFVAINGTDLSSMPSGNTFTIAATPATFATVAVGSPAGSGSFTDSGNDINVWQSQVSVGNHAVTLNRLSLRQIGSISSNDIKNFRLQVDGTTVATVASLDSNGYVTFTPGTTLNSGTRTLTILADVTGGSGRTEQMSLRGAYDISTTDTQYGQGVLATGTFPANSAQSTVAAGNLTVVKASDSPSANLVACANDSVLGRWTFTAFGEVEKVESLTIGVDVSSTDSTVTLRNGRILVDGTQVGNTTDVAAADAFASGQSFTTNFYVTPGTPRTVEFRADMFDSEGADEICATHTITSVQASILAGTGNVVPQTSLGTQGVPASAVNANAMTVASGSIALAQNPTYASAQTTTAPSTNFKLGSWNLSGNSSEAVNINTLTVGFAGTDAFDPSDDLNNVYLKVNGTQTAVKGTVADGSSTTLANTYSVNINIPVGGTVTVDLYADIASGATDGDGSADTMIAYLRATGVTASSSTTVYADSDSDNDNTDAGSTGQTITIGSGTITATTDASSPVSALVDDSGTVTTAAFKFAAVTDSYTITDLNFTLANASAVSSVALMDGSTTLATKPGATSLSFSGLNVAVAANTNKVLTVVLTMSTIGVGAGTSGSSLLTTLTSFTARNSSGTSDVSANDAGPSIENDPAGNVMYAYKAVPTVTNVTLPTNTLVGGTQTIAKFTVNSNGTGAISWNKIIFTVTASTNATIADGTASTSLWDADTNTQVSGTSTAAGLSTGGATGSVTFVPSAEQQISGAKTYYLKATIGGTLTAGDSVSTNIAQPSSFAAPATYATVALTTASLVWSDVSAANHSTTTSDWNNGFLVKNLPTDTQTLVK